MSSHILRIVLACLLAVPVARSHAPAGTVRGTVIDRESGTPVIGAIVSLVGTRFGTTTALDGSFVLTSIPDSTYVLSIRHLSYAPASRALVVHGPEDPGSVRVVLTPTTIQQSETVVEGRMGSETEGAVRSLEKMSITSLNAISANAIEAAPDITVANVVQRVSGLSVERSNTGDGQYAIVRGMDKRYNYTLIDGIKVPSPDSRNRYVPLDIFPSDLLERLVVLKVLTPEMEGDAVGGVVNMVMRDAPPTFHLKVSASGGYGERFVRDRFVSFDRSASQATSPEERFGASYRATPADFPIQNSIPKSEPFSPNTLLGLSFGMRMLDDVVGVAAAGSYQNTHRGAHTLFFPTLVDQATNLPTIQSIQSREYDANQQRLGIHAKIDARIAIDHRLTLSGTYVRLGLAETRTASDTSVNINKRQGVGTGDIANSFRSTSATQTTAAIALHGDHAIPFNGTFSWTYAFADARLDEPDRCTVSVTTGISRGGGDLVHAPVLAAGMERRWNRNDDLDHTVKSDVVFHPTLFGIDIDWKSGVFYRSKTRSNYYDRYSLTPDPIRQEWNGTFGAFTYSVDDPSGTPDDALNYASHESVFSFFSQASIRVGDLIVLGGIRNERTEFGWTTKAPPTVVGKSGSVKYDDVLPSLTLKYVLSTELDLKLSYFASISRPGFLEVIPYAITQEDYVEQGNPYLNRAQADNVDARFEYFPSATEQFLLGAFYKQIADPIEYTLQVKPPNILYLMPGNFGTATNFGIEADVTKYFAVFGIRANYTFTHSAITTLKLVRYRDVQGSLTVRNENQTRPMQGQSAHVGNLSLLYRDLDSGTDAQVSFVYTGSRIASVSPYKDNDVWQLGTLHTDVSAEQTLTSALSLFAKINNIFDVSSAEEIRLVNAGTVVDIPDQSPHDNILVRRDTFGRTYLLGVRLKL